jgi:hypothetical protein
VNASKHQPEESWHYKANRYMIAFMLGTIAGIGVTAVMSILLIDPGVPDVLVSVVSCNPQRSAPYHDTSTCPPEGTGCR